MIQQAKSVETGAFSPCCIIFSHTALQFFRFLTENTLKQPHFAPKTVFSTPLTGKRTLLYHDTAG